MQDEKIFHNNDLTFKNSMHDFTIIDLFTQLFI